MVNGEWEEILSAHESLFTHFFKISGAMRQR